MSERNVGEYHRGLRQRAQAVRAAGRRATIARGQVERGYSGLRAPTGRKDRPRASPRVGAGSCWSAGDGCRLCIGRILWLLWTNYLKACRCWSIRRTSIGPLVESNFSEVCSTPTPPYLGPKVALLNDLGLDQDCFDRQSTPFKGLSGKVRQTNDLRDDLAWLCVGSRARQRAARLDSYSFNYTWGVKRFGCCRGC